MFDLNNNKALTPVIGIILLLFVSIIAVYFLKDIPQKYNDDMSILYDAKNIKYDFEIIRVSSTYIYLRNDFRDNFTINSIKVAGNICNKGRGVSINRGYVAVDIGGCLRNLSEVAYDVAVYTNYGVKSEYEIIRSPPISNFVVVNVMGACDISSGYFGYFSMDDLNNSHAGSYLSTTYNTCIKNLDYTIGNSSSGNYVTLFYMTELNNSAVWINKSSVYMAPSNWYDISISSSGGTFSYVVNSSDMTSSNYTCAAKIIRDDVYGSHIGSCSSTSMNQSLWIRLI